MREIEFRVKLREATIADFKISLFFFQTILNYKKL